MHEIVALSDSFRKLCCVEPKYWSIAFFVDSVHGIGNDWPCVNSEMEATRFANAPSMFGIVDTRRWCCPHLFVGLLIMATTYSLCYQETAIRLKFELHVCSRALTRV